MLSKLLQYYVIMKNKHKFLSIVDKVETILRDICIVFLFLQYIYLELPPQLQQKCYRLLKKEAS